MGNSRAPPEWVNNDGVVLIGGHLGEWMFCLPRFIERKAHNTMARMDFQAKGFLRDIIADALDSMNVDSDDAVQVLGKYGEKGVVFFAQNGTPESPDSGVGFMIVSRNEPGKHLNMSRDQAVALTELLVSQFGLEVNVQPVVSFEVTVS